MMGIGLGLMMAAALSPSAGFASTVPYPRSRLLTAVSWDFSTVASLRKARGSDLWPLAWAADGNLYGAWGDGGGFDGGANNIGRVSLGVARISGVPDPGAISSYSGANVWGDAPLYAESPAKFGGKVDDLISIGGVLYGQGGLWTAANCGCANPVVRSGANFAQHNLTWSADLGRTWHIAPWTSTSEPGASLQYGRNYSGAWDPSHVYFYYQSNVGTDASHLFLRRMRTTQMVANPATPGHFEYVTGVDDDGRPTWSTTQSKAAPVFYDPGVPSGTYASASIVYDAALGRYLLAAMHGSFTGQIGFFEAPTPWGPWSTVAYYDDWGGFNESAGEANGLSFPAKWFSADGRTAWGVFSGVTNGFDAFNVVKAVFTTSSAVPQIVSPAQNTVLAPGETVTARGSGTRLSWSMETLTPGSTSFAPASEAGTGPVFSFSAPAAGALVRITLTSRDSGGDQTVVYRDFSIASGPGGPEIAHWEFNEDSGNLAKDSSGAGNTGTLLNSVIWVQGKAGTALDFRGGRGAVVVSGAAGPGHNAAVNSGVADTGLANLYRHGLTVMAWIKPRSSGLSGRIVDKDDNDAGWFLKMSGAGLQFVADQFSTTAATRNSARPIALGTWQHVAATWDGSNQGTNVHLFVGGTASDGAYANGEGAASDDSSVPLTIGNRQSDMARGFDGVIDDVRVFDRVLSPAEIAKLN
jgi:hypothetical protein